MSDAQYDLTLALLDDAELDRWDRIIDGALRRAREAGDDTELLARRVYDVTVERERRKLERSGS